MCRIAWVQLAALDVPQRAAQLARQCRMTHTATRKADGAVLLTAGEFSLVVVQREAPEVRVCGCAAAGVCVCRECQQRYTLRPVRPALKRHTRASISKGHTQRRLVSTSCRAGISFRVGTLPCWGNLTSRSVLCQAGVDPGDHVDDVALAVDDVDAAYARAAAAELLTCGGARADAARALVEPTAMGGGDGGARVRYACVPSPVGRVRHTLVSAVDLAAFEAMHGNVFLPDFAPAGEHDALPAHAGEEAGPAEEVPALVRADRWLGFLQ